jgi:hypothetical protein
MKIKSQLKKIIERLSSFFDSFARARAAAELANCGHYTAANRLINGKNIIDE